MTVDKRLAAMAVERLKWLVWLCNFSGLLPFRMILKDHARFSHFDFKWKHPVTWWFLLNLMGHVFYLVLFVMDMVNMQTSDKVDLSSYSRILMLAIVVVQLSLLANFNCPLLILFHTKKLRTAFESLRHVDLVLDRIPNSLCTTQLQTFVGSVFVLILVMNCITALSSNPNVLSSIVFIRPLP